MTSPFTTTAQDFGVSEIEAKIKKACSGITEPGIYRVSKDGVVTKITEEEYKELWQQRK
jgi:hypothetical protein